MSTSTDRAQTHVGETYSEKVDRKTFMPRPWQTNHLTLPQFELTYREEISAIYNRFFRDNGKIDCTYAQWVDYCYSHSTKVKPRFPLA